VAGSKFGAFRLGSELASARGMTPKRFVYVLKTRESTPRYYVGVTSNLEQRLAWHNQGHCTHTAKYRPWRSHVVVEFSDEAHATRFEQYLKSGSGRAFTKRHFD
jgi:putative endonuclease